MYDNTRNNEYYVLKNLNVSAVYVIVLQIKDSRTPRTNFVRYSNIRTNYLNIDISWTIIWS
jgi:hypothetical protein